jgi:hypothetical protein
MRDDSPPRRRHTAAGFSSLRRIPKWDVCRTTRRASLPGLPSVLSPEPGKAPPAARR